MVATAVTRQILGGGQIYPPAYAGGYLNVRSVWPIGLRGSHTSPPLKTRPSKRLDCCANTGQAVLRTPGWC